MGLALSLTAVVLLTGCYTLLCLWIQPNSFRYVVSIFRQQPLLIILNCVPVGALMLAFTFLFRNVFASACLVGTGCAVRVQGGGPPASWKRCNRVSADPTWPHWLALHLGPTHAPSCRRGFKADEGICLVAASVRQVPSVIWAQLTVEGLLHPAPAPAEMCCSP